MAPVEREILFILAGDAPPLLASLVSENKDQTDRVMHSNHLLRYIPISQAPRPLPVDGSTHDWQANDLRLKQELYQALVAERGPVRW